MVLSPLRAGKNHQKGNNFKTLKPPENNSMNKGIREEG